MKRLMTGSMLIALLSGCGILHPDRSDYLMTIKIFEDQEALEADREAYEQERIRRLLDAAEEDRAAGS